jgi:hypothetical protein
VKYSLLLIVAISFFMGGACGSMITASWLHEPTQVVPPDYVWPTPLRTHTLPPDAKVCITHPDAKGDMYTDCVK